MRKNGDHVVGKGRMVDSLCLFVYVHEYIPRKLMNFPPTVHKPSNSSDFKPLTFYWRNFPQKNIYKYRNTSNNRENIWKIQHEWLKIWSESLHHKKCPTTYTFRFIKLQYIRKPVIHAAGIYSYSACKIPSKILIVTFWRTNDW